MPYDGLVAETTTQPMVVALTVTLSPVVAESFRSAWFDMMDHVVDEFAPTMRMVGVCPTE